MVITVRIGARDRRADQTHPFEKFYRGQAVSTAERRARLGAGVGDCQVRWPITTRVVWCESRQGRVPLPWLFRWRSG